MHAAVPPARRAPLGSSLERLLTKTVLDSNGCLLWQGAKARGYGHVRVPGGRVVLAHRLAFALSKGPVPEGMVVLHTCDVPSCINPEHLRLGTQAENNRERGVKGRHGRRGQRRVLSWNDTHAGVVMPGESVTECADGYHAFWERVDRADGCWEWLGQKQRQGYGQVGWMGKRYSAHRFAWLVTYGPIPERQFVCHRCDNPHCVRPDHLFLGTAQENSMDRDQKGRQVGGDRHWTRRSTERLTRRFGESNPAARLTAEQVRQIRSRYVPRKVPMAKLAREFNVTVGAIFHIVHGRTWKV